MFVNFSNQSKIFNNEHRVNEKIPESFDFIFIV